VFTVAGLEAGNGSPAVRGVQCCPDGGNPAGVVLDATGVPDNLMLATAAQVGYSETAFLTPRGGSEFDVRYFSPRAEVSFLWARDRGQRGRLRPAARHRRSAVAYKGRAVAVRTADAGGQIQATLTSVTPRTVALPETGLRALLAARRWHASDLDPVLPPRVAYAGAWHPVIAAAGRARLADLDYDFDALAELMAAHDWTTVDLIYRAPGGHTFWSRNPFPPGGVVEDAATGAAAAAFGGYLRELGLISPPAQITIHRGDDKGRPGVLRVDIPQTGGIDVGGTAVPIPGSDTP
jgi:PhzF family phenazine biosynthesis protein